ncbi:DUF368 domain-containing protein [Orenia metallireducens]|uniref:DUF368 domain-containing protein n=1 Tax=Orenia metallireducens TaxID=1413210 RepID=A0A1C0A5E9_9FIRM|nr:DUF368 domain-containing protein [Orenia metallireducens]OCL25336.1 DUF368 domain-containing protein [Orenia metallireducens]
MNDFWQLVIKGIPIGISNTLPGISGGTIALILNIYEKLINGIKRINFKILIPVGLGAVIGVLFGSKVITGLLESDYRGFLVAFLLGLIFASSKVTAKEVEKFNLKTIALALLGLGLAYRYSIDIDSAQAMQEANLFKFFWGGAIGSVAMILPGVSGGTILIMLGLYQGVLQAITTLDLPIIIFFGFGVVAGLLSFSWILSYLLEHYNSLLMAFLTGLILGSMRSVIPNQIGFLEIIGFVLGVLLILWLDKREE